MATEVQFDSQEIPSAAIMQELAQECGLDILSLDFAKHMDQTDELAGFRDKFFIPPSNCDSSKNSLYLCGNSLGCQPKTLEAYVMEEIVKWRKYGVEGHFKTSRPWVTVDETVQEQSAIVVGAKPIEVVVMNSLTVNLHLFMTAFYRPSATRFKIMLESKAFPSDEYAVQSQVKLAGLDPASALIEMEPRAGEATLRLEDILSRIEEEGDSIALIMFSGVQYYTGQLFDIEAITRAGHAKGCKVGFDLAHAVGNVPLQLHAWDVDFAVWCSYKYLNSGPGGIAGAFLHERHSEDSSLLRLAGWWGHRKDDRFKMGPNFHLAPGAAGFALSNPPVLITAALRASLDVMVEAGLARMRNKSLKLTGYLEQLLLARVPRRLMRIITPTSPDSRGCQLSLVFPFPVRDVFTRLTELGVICDMREPDVLRIAPVPLYNSFADVHEFVELLLSVLLLPAST